MVRKHRADLPVLCSCFPLASYFTFGSVCMSMALSHFVPASPSPSLCPQVHSLCLHLYSCPAPRLFRTIFFRLALGILKPGSTNCSQEIGELSEYVCKILWVEDPEFWSKSQRQPWPTLKYPNSFIRNTPAQLYMWPPAIIWCSPHLSRSAAIVCFLNVWLCSVLQFSSSVAVFTFPLEVIS